MGRIFYLNILILLLISCKDNEEVTSFENVEKTTSPASIGKIGNNKDLESIVSTGFLLMGGGWDVDKAMYWMIEKVNGGDIKILRASGGDAYNQYLFNLADGRVNSVETLLIDSRDLANDQELIKNLETAEGIFIAGGNQADYVKFWGNTKLAATLARLVIDKKIVLGGTSAGCAILGEYIFDALKGTVYSDEVLNDPYIEYASLQKNTLFDIEILQNVITDTHYNNPSRIGRHIAFMARLKKDFNSNAKGIGVEEETAVVIEEDGLAHVFGKGKAYFLESIGSDLPEVIAEEKPLTWGINKKAIRALVLKENTEEYIDLNNWNNFNSSLIQLISVENGVLKIENK